MLISLIIAAATRICPRSAVFGTVERGDVDNIGVCGRYDPRRTAGQRQGRSSRGFRNRTFAGLIVLPVSLFGVAIAGEDAADTTDVGKNATAHIVKAEVVPRGQVTCFSVVSIGRLAPEVFSVTAPHRVVIDAVDASFRWTQPPDKTAGGVVGAFRFGLLAPGRARIVVDVAKGTQIGRIASRPLNKKMHLLSISLSADAAARSSRSCLAGSDKVEQVEAPGRRVEAKSAPVAGAKKPVVVIDPGHGGVDPGAVVNKVYLEKIIALAIGRRVATRLRKTGRFDVVMTRKRDVFVSLDDRVERARSKKADLFVSLHADSLDDPGQAARTQGASVYILSHKASDAAAKRMAEKENAADLLAGILPRKVDQDAGVRDILVDLLKRETEQESARLRRLVIAAMRRKVPVARNPSRSAAFHVLKQTETPAALIELGYMTNPADLKRMRQAEWQGAMAGAIATSIGQFFEKK